MLGAHYRNRGGGVTYMNAEQIVDHPLTSAAKSGIQDYDITLLKTNYEIEYTNRIQPVCLPTSPPDATKVTNIV